jgi:hypothetical protein
MAATFESRTISIRINRPADKVYDRPRRLVSPMPLPMRLLPPAWKFGACL